MALNSLSSRIPIRTSQRINWNAIFLTLVGVISLVFAEQVASGWLALGETVNVSRRDLNILELVVIAGGVLWGVLALLTALGVLSQRGRSAVREYFDNQGPMTAGIRFSVAVLAAVGIISLLIAAQALTGWITFGERANISRRDLNLLEWGVVILGAFWGILCLRTVLGFVRRERPAWSWGQLAFFLINLAGIVLLMAGTFRIPRLILPGETILSNLAGALHLAAPGLILLLSSLTAYRYITTDYGEVAPQKEIAGTTAERARARDISSARVPAGQSIRNRLAKSPGAGAIIGFIALFTFFTIASDLFFDPQSLAGALSNNVSRGIVAIGATMLMISGEFDLSVGSMLGIAGLTFLGLMTGQFPPGGPQLDPLTAAIITVIVVVCLGLLNGVILIKTQIPSFIVTLSTLYMFRVLPLVFIRGGGNLRYVDYFDQPPYIQISRVLLIIVFAALILGLLFIVRSVVITRFKALRERWANYSSDPDDFRTVRLIWSAFFLILMLLGLAGVVIYLGHGILDSVSQLQQGSAFLQVSFFDLANGRISSVPPFIQEIPREINLRMGVFWWIVLVIVFQFVLNQTRYGNATFAVGGNAGAARAQGINVNRIKIMNYMLVAGLVGIAGIFDAARLQSIDALRGQGLELQVIAATVIGGALLTGGYGSIIGALLGVFIYGIMQTGLVLIGVDALLFNGFIGAIILGAVIINSWSRRIKT